MPSVMETSAGSVSTTCQPLPRPGSAWRSVRGAAIRRRRRGTSHAAGDGSLDLAGVHRLEGAAEDFGEVRAGGHFDCERAGEEAGKADELPAPKICPTAVTSELPPM